MDMTEMRTLCLKHVYGASLTEAEQGIVDAYGQTTDGEDYLRECREAKDLFSSVADVRIKPVDEKVMIQKFERTVRENFKKTVFQSWWQANSAPLILGAMAGVFIAFDDGWSVVNTLLLGTCVLWLIVDCFQRNYMRKILNRPDLYDYAKASKRRSDRMLRRVSGRPALAVLSGLAVTAVAFGAYWLYREFGVIASAIATFVVVETIAIVVYQYRKLKSSDSEVWDWWEEEIKE